MNLILLLALAHHTGAMWSIDMGGRLVGKIIHVESLKRRGYWLNAYDQRHATIGGSAQNDVYFKSWSQFLVRDCDSGLVCLESIRYRSHYLAAAYSWWVETPKVYYPNDKDQYRWRISCTSYDMDRCWFHSQRKDYTNLYLTAEWADYWVEVQKRWPRKPWELPIISLFRILAPQPSERYIVVKRLANEGSKDLVFSLKYSYGVEKSTAISHTVKITADVAMEIRKAMTTKKGSLSLSYEWKKESKETFKESHEQTLKVTVPPFSIYTIKVLSGEYGPFIVKSKQVKVECVKMRTNEKCNGDNARVIYK